MYAMLRQYKLNSMNTYMEYKNKHFSIDIVPHKKILSQENKYDISEVAPHRTKPSS